MGFSVVCFKCLDCKIALGIIILGGKGINKIAPTSLHQRVVYISLVCFLGDIVVISSFS